MLADAAAPLRLKSMLKPGHMTQVTGATALGILRYDDARVEMSSSNRKQGDLYGEMEVLPERRRYMEKFQCCCSVSIGH